jgi:glycosyltransferase involved in cell wall biosynthesis
MKKRLSLLLPTRGRLHLVKRFLQSVVVQSTRPDLIEVILCVDEDDIESQGIVFEGLALKLVIGPRQTMGAYNAICLEHASGDITIAANDDIVIRTKGWDEKVRELDARYPDGIYLGYSNDLFKGPKLCTFPILSRKTCSVLAEPYPAIYKGAFIDVHLMDIFRRLEKRGFARICYAANIVFEHVHYRNNPDALDATYTDRLRFGDDLTFIGLADARRLEADRLEAHISGGIPESVPTPPPVATAPLSLIGIVPLCARKFLLDFDLPLGWRSHLFVWMVARYYYSRLRRIP